MKKLKLSLMLFILLTTIFKINAQNISVNYARNFTSDYELKIKGNKFIPVSENEFMVGYTQNIPNSPLLVNISIGARTKKPPPPWLIPLPIVYPLENNIEADEARFSKSSTNSLDFMAGIGYVFPHKAGSKFTISANLDLGISINNKQTLDFYFQNNKTGSLEIVKNQFNINPHLKLKYSLTKGIGINLGPGYSTIGGFNVISGLVINPFNDKNCPHRRCCGNCDPNFRP